MIAVWRRHKSASDFLQLGEGGRGGKPIYHCAGVGVDSSSYFRNTRKSECSALNASSQFLQLNYLNWLSLQRKEKRPHHITHDKNDLSCISSRRSKRNGKSYFAEICQRWLWSGRRYLKNSEVLTSEVVSKSSSWKERLLSSPWKWLTLRLLEVQLLKPTICSLVLMSSRTLPVSVFQIR